MVYVLKTAVDKKVKEWKAKNQHPDFLLQKSQLTEVEARKSLIIKLSIPPFAYLRKRQWQQCQSNTKVIERSPN